jgi:hypothetical protein
MRNLVATGKEMTTAEGHCQRLSDASGWPPLLSFRYTSVEELRDPARQCRSGSVELRGRRLVGQVRFRKECGSRLPCEGAVSKTIKHGKVLEIFVTLANQLEPYRRNWYVLSASDFGRRPWIEERPVSVSTECPLRRPRVEALKGKRSFEVPARSCWCRSAFMRSLLSVRIWPIRVSI